MKTKTRCAINDHGHIQTAARAALYRTAILDVALLNELGVQTTETVVACPAVAVEFMTMAWNKLTERLEPLFKAKDVSGQLCGVYYPSAFKSLMF